MFCLICVCPNSRPWVCGISSLGIDHTQILGDTIEKIAWQKGGIFKVCWLLTLGSCCDWKLYKKRKKKNWTISGLFLQITLTPRSKLNFHGLLEDISYYLKHSSSFLYFLPINWGWVVMAVGWAPDVRPHHPISKAESSNREIYFKHLLVLQYHPSSHYQES